MNNADCVRLDAIAPAFAFGALDAGERAVVLAHLRRCGRRHPGLRDALAVAAAIGAGVAEEARPAPALRERLLTAARGDRPAAATERRRRRRGFRGPRPICR